MEKELHTVGLGKVRRAAPRNRAAKAMKILKEYVERHAGVEQVSVSNSVNEHIWGKGAANPPKNVEVQVLVDEGTAHVELADMEFELPSEAEEEETIEEAETPEDLTDEELVEKNVDEVKEFVDAGTVEAQRALDVEYAGKNRKTLIEWLQDRVSDASEEPSDEPEEAEEADAEDAADEPEDDGEEAQEEEETGETYDIPDDVIDVFEDGTIGDGKDAAKELGKAEFEKLLNFEEAHQNRKGMKKFLRSNMN